jgi:hypothetical protein
MKVFLTVFILIFSISVSGCKEIRGSGDIVERDFPISGVSEISLMGSGRVYVEIGEKESLTIKGDDNILDILDIDVRGSDLELGKLKRRNAWINPTQPIEYRVTVTAVSALSVSGSGKIYLDDLKTETLELSISGSGDMILGPVVAKEVDVAISGSGNITVKGSTDDFSATISGSGDINAKKLKSEYANCRINGSGEINISVSERLEAAIYGSGDINYWGDPDTKLKESGSGDIHKMD